MNSSLSSPVDVVKNVIIRIARSRVQQRSSTALTLAVQEHIASLCHKRVPVCLDVFISCGCTSKNQEIFYTSPNKVDADCHKTLFYDDTAVGPIHVERWTCTFLNRRTSEGSISGYELLSSIGECIQRSQFSDWFRSHKGKRPYCIKYRLGAPDEVSDMSTTNVSFAQVFPIVHMDRNTCLQTAMASFFDSNESLSIDCKLCCISDIQDYCGLISLDDSSGGFSSSAFGDPSAGFSPLEANELPHKSGVATPALFGTSRSNCSSRSESPIASLHPFSSLVFPFGGSALKDAQRLPTVVLACGDSTSQPKPLDEAGLQTFYSEVRDQPLNDGLSNPDEELSLLSTVQKECSNKTPPDDKCCLQQSSSNTLKRNHSPVRIRSLPTSFSLRHLPKTDSHSHHVSKESNNVIGRTLANGYSGNRCFNSSTGLPLNSSPAPLKRGGVKHFTFDPQLTSPRRIRSSVSGGEMLLRERNEAASFVGKKVLSSSLAPSSPLLGTFEESLLNGRIIPVGAVDGFKADIAASGAFCAPHLMFPVRSYFFQLDEATAPWASPYLGVVNLRQLDAASSVCGKSRSRYYIPPKGTVQVALFNPNRTVLKMFVVLYDLSDMPPSSTTFIRQRTLYMPVNNGESSSSSSSVVSPGAGSNNGSTPPLTATNASWPRSTAKWSNNANRPSFLRYVIHLRVATSARGRLFLHSDVRLIFASDRFEFDSRVAAYEMRSFTELPCNPRYSPRK